MAQTTEGLGKLADPEHYIGPIETGTTDAKLLLEQMRDMLEIRFAEEKIAEQILEKKIVCPCHLTIGQEAISVGVAEHLRNTDRAYGTHRSHGHYLAMGGDLRKLFAEILGKVTGCSKGMGGSMHLYDQPNGFAGSVPIVAGTVSLAVGASLAAKMEAARNKKPDSDVGITFFGDGAAEEGSVHESLNFASVYELPVLFVCENNLFSSHLHINLRQPSDRVARYADAHGVEARVVDGNDIVAVSKAAKELIDRARAGKGPGFLETVTYRWRGHVGPSEDIDVGLKRSEDLKQWKRRDPVARLKTSMIKSGTLTDASFEAMEKEVRSKVDEAWTMAEADPYPEQSALLDVVYAKGSSVTNGGNA